MIVDLENGKEAVLQGLNSIGRGDFTELHTPEDLQRFFGDIIVPGEKRLATKRKAAGTYLFSSFGLAPFTVV